MNLNGKVLASRDSPGKAASRRLSRNHHSPAACTTQPASTAPTDAAAPGPSAARTASGMTAKLSTARPAARKEPRPKGFSRTEIASWASGVRLVTMIAAAHPIAAPVIPNRGMRSRSRPTLITSAAMPLARLQLLRPVVIKTMSTWPQAVASSIVRPRMIITRCPAR